MLENMNFYKFMHKQILILIALFAGTATSYLFFGLVYGSVFIESMWYTLVLIVSYWGWTLHKSYDESLTVEEKDKWLAELRYFLFFYFSTWTIMFIVYVSRSNVELHYLAIFTQLGVATVATTILVTEKKLSLFILTSSMLPITIYLMLIGEFYSYVIGFLTIVLAGVLLYGSRNTYNYLLKSRFQAYHDYLTKLGNRRYFIEILEDAIKVQKDDDKYTYLLLIDLDHFKTINDTLGHDIGDLLLIEVADRMSKLAKMKKSSVSRLGGDEFCILSTTSVTKEICLDTAQSFAEDLLHVIKQTYIIEGHHLYISASIGISLINNPDVTASVFIKEADIAMYEAKSKGRDGVILFSDELSTRIERKLEIERLLHFAIEDNEIKLQFQPQNNSNGEVLGCEVLARWHNDKLGQISPDEFIPISEETGIIVELGFYILEEAFKTLKEWDDKGLELKQLSINISMRQFFDTSFVEDVQKLCKKYLNGELNKKLIFEMTETTVADDVSSLIEKMEKLKECGIRFSMDDFGTGYSSLSYLSKIPIDELKIDKSFVMGLDSTSKDKKIVKTIIDIAKNLGLSIVAEGVETEEQKEFLTGQSCDILQGYHFSKPIDKEDFEEYLIASSKK